jgi:CRP-like cAMP-binding protein
MSLPLSQASVANLLLRGMSPADYLLLQPHLERADGQLGDCLFEPGRVPDWVWFPERGVASILTEGEDGDQIEVGLYGLEGMSGGATVLGAGHSPHRSFVQVGEASFVRLPPDRLLDACSRSATLHGRLLRYVHVLDVQTGLTAASNAHYALPERLARWLLMCHDRVEDDRLILTHEFMSMMLAVRRSGVTVTLHMLEGTGAIRSTRGLVTVRDRGRLEEIAGESYGGAEREYRRLLGPFGKAPGT